MSGLLTAIDDKLAELLSQWDNWTIVLGLAVVLFIGHSIVTASEPDIHPLILSRQSYADRVRNPGESAVYRSPDAPHGTPLRSGLAVKFATDKPYTAGRDGDLRNIWQRVTGEIPVPPVPGVKPTENKETKIYTAFGKEKLEYHSIKELSKEIAVIGSYLKKHGSKRVAVYLPNSAEFLVTLFAASFYGLSVILIPFNQPHELVVDLLKETKADALVAAAGSIPLELLTKGYPSLKQLVWFVEKTSRHMDWTDVPSGAGGDIDVSVWHELIQDHEGNDLTLPSLSTSELGDIVTIWQNEPSTLGEAITFTHAHFAAAIAALLAAVPARQRVNANDTFFSADAWTDTYALTQTLAALFAGADLAIASVAGPMVDLTFAAKNISPTVVVASSDSLALLHDAVAPSVRSGLARLTHASQQRTLAAGTMPTASLLTPIAGATRAAIGSSSETLRLLFVSEKVRTGNAPLSSRALGDIRVFTGARVVYALTAARVAGAVAQTNVFDYRVTETASTGHAHFGVPLGSVEVKLLDSGKHRTTEDKVEGEIIVTGTSVAGGQAKLGIPGAIREDGTLSYV